MRMKMLKQVVVTILVSASCASVYASNDEIVLQTDQFVVTKTDFERYLKERNVSEDRAQQMLSKEGAVRNAFENIYVIKAFAMKGKENDAIDMNEIDWMVEHYRHRLLMTAQLDLEVQKALENYDWDSAAFEEYQATKQKYRLEERVNADHILISFSDRSEEEALEKAKLIKSRLEDGEDFGTLAKEESDDAGSKSRGGALGLFGRGKMVPEFEAAAFAIEEDGQISDLVRTDFGYHIIKLRERRPARQREFDEVKKTIVNQVKQRVEQEVRSDKITAVKNGEIDLGLEVNVALLEEIEKSYLPDPVEE